MFVHWALNGGAATLYLGINGAFLDFLGMFENASLS